MKETSDKGATATGKCTSHLIAVLLADLLIFMAIYMCVLHILGLFSYSSANTGTTGIQAQIVKARQKDGFLHYVVVVQVACLYS